MGYEEPEKTFTDKIKDKLGMKPSELEPSPREFDEDAMKRSTKYQKKNKKSSGKDRKDKGKSNTKRPPKPQQQLKKKERPENFMQNTLNNLDDKHRNLIESIIKKSRDNAAEHRGQGIIENYLKNKLKK